MSPLLRAFALLLAASSLLVAFVPTASAQQTTCQQFTNIVGGNFGQTYLVAGRVIDAFGKPVAAGNLTIDLQQENVKFTPFNASTDAFGVYLAYFDIKHVDPKAKLKITFHGENGAPDTVNETNLDPFWRRSDIMMRYEGTWTKTCKNTELFDKRVSLQGRIVNRTDPLTVSGETYDSAPYAGRMSLRWIDADGVVTCPPSSSGGGPDACDFLVSDARGDFRYSFVLDQPVNASGHFRIRAWDKDWNVTIDPTFRSSWIHLEGTGRGAPIYNTNPSPAPPVAFAIALTVGLALVLRRR